MHKEIFILLCLYIILIIILSVIHEMRIRNLKRHKENLEYSLSWEFETSRKLMELIKILTEQNVSLSKELEEEKRKGR